MIQLMRFFRISRWGITRSADCLVLTRSPLTLLGEAASVLSIPILAAVIFYAAIGANPDRAAQITREIAAQPVGQHIPLVGAVLTVIWLGASAFKLWRLVDPNSFSFERGTRIVRRKGELLAPPSRVEYVVVNVESGQWPSSLSLMMEGGERVYVDRCKGLVADAEYVPLAQEIARFIGVSVEHRIGEGWHD